MVTLFEKLEEKRQKSSGSPNTKSRTEGDNADEGQKTDSWLGIAFASHPSDAERIQFFRDAAAR
ncbi:MAG: hypothetical protein V4772_13900, partial [Pseudomonadota bacterium]